MPRPPRADTQRLGAEAEQAACALLQARGLQLLARNVRYPFGEIDLIMRDGATVAFVEVRRRKNFAFGGAAASVDARKRRKIALAAQAWLSGTPAYRQAACRFDVVAVQEEPDGLSCEWLPAAFTLNDVV
ncbi:YraN family protein [Arenimonas oryziterrae]|uniref:UPF0102 protein N789_11410 n=1 Tax=Arenimonas oryziterrae DSM 21050 = YC6267 TaxID=1121015 RepID=A0A091ASJ6_9GAMM|nr:YraN family protein [Arenimonas oryziterrae]KFN43163.1 hypothetical protein N789_11410 [Arenimonas oryziterrae DSM 21050 = YC6267]